MKLPIADIMAHKVVCLRMKRARLAMVEVVTIFQVIL